ncbi:hypothetical protein FXO37_05803 [Capsicum annuum]|nr:hypothetical protein FXO37_05803 [Capsicum annuum]
MREEREEERKVQDLHSITPDHFLEVSGAVIHPLSYQQARNFRFNCGLVYIAEPGYMLYRAGVPRHSIIKKFAGEGISRLEDLISVLSKLSRGARVPLEYINYKERHQKKQNYASVWFCNWVYLGDVDSIEGHILLDQKGWYSTIATDDGSSTFVDIPGLLAWKPWKSEVLQSTPAIRA